MRNRLTKNVKPLSLAIVALGLLGIWINEARGLINVFRLLDPASTYPDGTYPYPASFWQINQLFAYVSMALIAGGMLLFFFSKERDEYTNKVRLEALRFAALVQVSLVVGFMVYSELTASLLHMQEAAIVGSLLLFWATYVFRYYYVLYRHAKSDVIDS